MADSQEMPGPKTLGLDWLTAVLHDKETREVAEKILEDSKNLNMVEHGSF